MLGSALEAFAGLTGLSKTLIVLGLVAVVSASAIGIYGYWHHEVYQSGVNDTIAAIAREDKALTDRTWEARQKWQACRDRGRGWDQTTGSCQ